MPVFDGVKLKKCLACFDEPHLESYFHQLVDSWKCRGKLNFKDHSSVIGLENWWDLEAELKQLAKAFVNSETELEVGENGNSLLIVKTRVLKGQLLTVFRSAQWI